MNYTPKLMQFPLPKFEFYNVIKMFSLLVSKMLLNSVVNKESTEFKGFLLSGSQKTKRT